MKELKKKISDIRLMLDFIQDQVIENESDTGFCCLEEGVDRAWIALENVTGYNNIQTDIVFDDLRMAVIDKIKAGHTRIERIFLAYAISNLFVKEGILDFTVFESYGHISDVGDNENVEKFANTICEELPEDSLEDYKKITTKIKSIDRLSFMKLLDKNIANLLDVNQVKDENSVQSDK
jgi:hypothetical protein